MTNLIIAQRAYQANVTVFERPVTPTCEHSRSSLTMSLIPPIQPISPGARPIEATRVVGGGETAAADPTGGFGEVIGNALENLNQSQRQTDELSRAAATGDLSRVEDLMVAMNETQLMTQLTSRSGTVRSRPSPRSCGCRSDAPR